jgi:hypothetical protein
MVPIAIFLAIGEAQVARSSLLASGIPCHLGSWSQIGTEATTVALGGLRLWVPAVAYADASDVLRAMPGDTEVEVLQAAKRRLLVLLAAYLAAMTAIGGWFTVTVGSLIALPVGMMLSVLSLFGMPIPPPPWRGDYFLSPISSDQS